MNAETTDLRRFLSLRQAQDIAASIILFSVHLRTIFSQDL